MLKQTTNKVDINELIYALKNCNELQVCYKDKHIFIEPIDGGDVDFTWGKTIDEFDGASFEKAFDIPLIDGKSIRQMADAGELTWDE